MPLVLDADALNAFAGDPERLTGRDGVDVIITPHPGEMARLLNISIEEVQADRLEHAREFAAAHRCHVVLKGHRTIIAGPEGRSFVNLTGNAGMATGGTGDLLTGMIAAWFAQILDAEGACKLAVYLHGTAGDLAEADEGEVALLPTDIAARLGDAVLELTARRKIKRDHTATRGGNRARRRGPRQATVAGTSSCSTASSARARPRSCAAWRAASAVRPTRCRARRSRSSRNTLARVPRCITSISIASPRRRSTISASTI